MVTLSGRPGEDIFYDSQTLRRYPNNPRAHAVDAEYFEGLLWDTCEQYNAAAHAYVLEPNASLIIIQTLGAPLAWLVHDLVACYSMHLNGRSPVHERFFPQRYKAQLVQPEKLPYAVRYVQRRGRLADRPRRVANHPFSSSMIYCGRRPRPKCFVLHSMLQALASLGYSGREAYFEFMAMSDSPSIAHMLSQRVIGDRDYIESLYELSMAPRRAPSPDEVLREVTITLLNNEPAVACSSTHVGALARALVAWYAMRTGAAQIGAVARWFDVTSSSLRYLIRRHRQINPQYFSLDVGDLFPNWAAQSSSLQHRQPRAAGCSTLGTLPASGP